MLSYFFRQLISSCGIFVRTIRAFFTRKLTGLWARLRRMTNFSRQATKVAADSFQGAAAAMKKPTKREDFIETRRLFISKSFLVMLVVGIAALALAAYFAVWPFLLSHFFTARFPVDDKRVGTWTGRVVVYADHEKTRPLYAGRLEEGVLQGKGTEYDAEGLVSYEGDFADGTRSGLGKAFENGALVYEGEFSAGIYSGQGKRYTDGSLSYAGSFSSGAASGEGIAYGADGAAVYRGQFADGVREGHGIAYYPTGQQSYLGAFSAGVREGEGTEYDKTGRVLYRGSFSQDRYSGDGIYYPAEGESVAASFESGATGGAIQWYKDGTLYYEGSADNLTPSGYGTVYSAAGKALYEGEMLGGTLNGAWLLGQTAEEIRAAFGGAGLAETASPAGGFTIASPQLGAAVVCSYASAEEEATAYEVYLWAGADDRLSLLPWENGVPVGRWAAGTPETDAQALGFPAGVGIQAGAYQLLRYSQDTCALEVLSTKDASSPAALHWSAVSGMPPEGALPAEGGEAEVGEAAVEAFLASLDQMQGAVAVAGSNPYLGEGDPVEALAAAGSPGAAAALADAYLDYLAAAEARAALEEERVLKSDLRSAAQAEVGRGGGDGAAVEALAAEVDALTGEIEARAAAMKKAGLLAEDAGGAPPADLALGGLAVLFDPAELDTGDLPLTAVSYAQAVAEDPQSVDAAAIELELKLALVDLGTLYGEAEDARTAYGSAAESARAASGAYAMGQLDRAELYAAQCARAEARKDLYGAICAFTRQVNSLNDLTGGWISRTNGWCAGALLDLYDAGLRSAAEAPQPEAQPTEGPEAQPSGEPEAGAETPAPAGGTN